MVAVLEKKMRITAKRVFKNMMLYLKVIVLDNYYLYRKTFCHRKNLIIFHLKILDAFF